MTTVDRCFEPVQGEHKSLSLEQALSRILSAVSPVTDTEQVPLAQANGRILAEQLRAEIDLPPFPNSAMDGYALRYADLAPVHEQSVFNITGSAFAGAPYLRALESGACIRILTGAAIPSGADTVVMQEDVRRQDHTLRPTGPVKAGANIRHPGDDIVKGAVLIEAGKALTPADIGLIASSGTQQVQVKRKLRIAYFSTGDELSPLGSSLAFGQIYDSNRYMLHALLDTPCITGIDMGIVRDDPETLEATLKKAGEQADVILTSGGVSVGDADHVVNLLEKTGKIEFWKVAIKPGKPCAFGRIGRSWFFGLPGNPVAVLVVFSQLVRPALDKLSGCVPRVVPRFKARCISALKKAPGRIEFQRGILGTNSDGQFEVESTGAQGSNRISSASRANCYIVLPPENNGIAAGEMVDVELFESFL